MMSMDIPRPPKPEQQMLAETMLENSQAILREAVEVVTGDAEADPLTVFPPARERRDDAPDPEFTEDQETRLRTAAAELGFGRTSDRIASEVGLNPGYIAIIDGGMVHKVKAEIELALADDVQPGRIVVAASSGRKIDSTDPEAADEVESVKYQLGLTPTTIINETEYSITKKLLATVPRFIPLEEPREVPLGYDIDNNNASIAEPTGQFLEVGTIGNVPVVLLRIDRENYIDEDGKAKYRKQPDSAGTMAIVSDALAASGDTGTALGFITGSNYQTSREVDAVRAMLSFGRIVAVPTYGAQRLARVKGKEVLTPAPINQLPGELHHIAKQIKKLEQSLSETVL